MELFSWTLEALTDTYTLQALPQIQDLPEFKAIDDEEARKVAFAKFVKRQKVRPRSFF